MGCAILAVLLYLRTPKPPEVVRFEIRPPSMITAQDAPRISPDGRILVSIEGFEKWVEGL